jgi:hypothetical protein
MEREVVFSSIVLGRRVQTSFSVKQAFQVISINNSIKHVDKP